MSERLKKEMQRQLKRDAEVLTKFADWLNGKQQKPPLNDLILALRCGAKALKEKANAQD